MNRFGCILFYVFFSGNKILEGYYLDIVIHWVNIFIHSGCNSKTAYTSGSYTTDVWRWGSHRLRYQHIWYLVKVHFGAHDIIEQKKGRRSWQDTLSLFCKGTNSFRNFPLWPNDHTPTYTHRTLILGTLEVRISTYVFFQVHKHKYFSTELKVRTWMIGLDIDKVSSTDPTSSSIPTTVDESPCPPTPPRIFCVS